MPPTASQVGQNTAHLARFGSFAHGVGETTSEQPFREPRR